MKIFNEQHEMFRATVRAFVDKEIAPHVNAPVERFARDARLMTIGGGTSEIMREIIAKALLP